jgi:hypothetical protein
MPNIKDLITAIRRVLGRRLRIVRIVVDEQNREVGRIERGRYRMEDERKSS